MCSNIDFISTHDKYLHQNPVNCKTRSCSRRPPRKIVVSIISGGRYYISWKLTGVIYYGKKNVLLVSCVKLSCGINSERTFLHVTFKPFAGSAHVHCNSRVGRNFAFFEFIHTHYPHIYIMLCTPAEEIHFQPRADFSYSCGSNPDGALKYDSVLTVIA